MSYTAPAYSAPDNSAIDITRPDGVRTTLVAADEATASTFAAALAGEFGAVAPFVPPAPDRAQIRRAIETVCAMRIAAVLQGKEGSMQRQASYLLQQAVLGQALSDEEKQEVAMFDAINAWETDMVARREELIAAGDAARAMRDDAWHTPPDGLAEFLAGF